MKRIFGLTFFAFAITFAATCEPVLAGGLAVPDNPAARHEYIRATPRGERHGQSDRNAGDQFPVRTAAAIGHHGHAAPAQLSAARSGRADGAPPFPCARKAYGASAMFRLFAPPQPAIRLRPETFVTFIRDLTLPQYNRPGACG